MHTSDGGKAWEYQDTGLRDFYSKVTFVDREHGWLAGGYPLGSVMRTTDGGRGWEKCATNPDMPALRYLQFLDNDIGFVAGDGNYVCRTTDGGTSWTDSYVGLGGIWGMFFINPNYGYVIARGLFRTTDGGSSWQQVSSFGLMQSGDLFFADSVNGWFASSSSGIYRTTDGGITWQSLSARVSLASISFPERTLGWAFGDDGIYASVDSGNTWTKQSDLGQLNQGLMLNRSLGYACGGFGFLYRTTDGGKNWSEISHHATTGDLRGVHMYRRDRVWAAGGNNLIGGVIIFSSDSGESWTTQYNQSYASLRSLAFADSASVAWACGVSGTAVHTTDGGVTWNSYSMPVTVGLHKLFFKDTMHGWCAGDGAILRTIDGGSLWSVYNDSVGYEYHGLFFVDANQGWAVGGDQNSGTGIIRMTTDGGISWRDQFRQPVAVLLGVCFIDSLRGWAIGDTMLQTTNGGTSWTPIPRPANTTFTCMEFADQNNGWMGGYSGNIYHTSNGGLSWDLLRTPTTGWIQDLVMASDETGYAVGDVGVVLKARNEPVNSVEPPLEEVVPRDFDVFQNFPNPFNPTTTIRYIIHKSIAHVTITVYNIIGQRVRILLDRVQQKGIHEIQWDGRTDARTYSPTGVYFYQVNVDGEEHTKRMGLLK